MQKLEMDLTSKLLVPKTAFNTLEITLELSKGPVNKLMGLKRLIEGLEQQTLADLTWQRITPTNKDLQDLTEQTLLFNNTILTYQLYGLEVVDTKEVWCRAFLRQAEIWLFAAKITSRLLEVLNGAS
jgi:hypothetical protein